MTTKEITTQYANEDLTTLENHGALAITDTLYGVLWLAFENGVYSITVNGNEVLNTKRKALTRSFLMNAYKIA